MWLPSTISFQSPCRTASCGRSADPLRQKSVRSACAAFPSQMGNRFMPSSAASAGTAVPVTARIDAVRSIVIPT